MRVVRKYLEINKNERKLDTIKVELRERFISANVYIKIKISSQHPNFTT